jgi:tetratricopeptide (TPR) repeat protein
MDVRKDGVSLYSIQGNRITYIRLLFLPINQNLDYDYPLYHSFFEPPVFFSFLFLAALCCLGVYVLYRSRKQGGEGNYSFKLMGWGILWFFITLSVESSIIPIKDVIFEHRLYLPSAGFIMALMGAIALAVQNVKSRRAVNIIAAGIIVILLVSGGATYARNSVWQNNIVLWEDVTKKSPFKVRPHINLGIAYDKAGRIDDAIREYLRALQIQPDAELHYNLATAYDKKGLFDDAVREYLKAIQMRPDFAEAHNNLGSLYGRQGRTEDAMNGFLTAIQINPDHANAHNNLGILYGMQGRIKDAIREFQTVLSLDPNHAGARKNLEMILRTKQ